MDRPLTSLSVHRKGERKRPPGGGAEIADDHVVALEVQRLTGLAAAFEIGGCRARREMYFANPSCDERLVRQLARAHHAVDILPDKVHGTVGHPEADLDIRIAGMKVGQRRDNDQERQRSTHVDTQIDLLAWLATKSCCHRARPNRPRGVVLRGIDIILGAKGIEHVAPFTGLDATTLTVASNSATIFSGLPSLYNHELPGVTANTVLADLRTRLSVINGAYVVTIPPPPVQGLGSARGFKMMLEDRAGSAPKRWRRPPARSSERGDRGAGKRQPC
jgi:hypothetical protein